MRTTAPTTAGRPGATRPRRSAPGPLRRFVTGHPVPTTAGLLVGLSWLAYAAAMAAGLPLIVGTAISLVWFVAVPLAVSAVVGGRSEVGRLLSRVARWRVPAGWWVVALVALPVLTIAVALATGTYRAPAAGWSGELVAYAVMGLLVWGVTGNVAEELAWGGFVQTRLMESHGMFVGSMLTAVPFALVHLPLAFDGQDLGAIAWGQVALGYGVTVAVAPVMRYVLGGALLGTGGSVLVVAAVHASFNASGRLSVVDGWWQYATALVVLAVLVAGHRRIAGRATATRVRAPGAAVS